MKVYVITSLIENEEDGAEVNVIGIRKTKQEAYLLMSEALSNAKEMYEENDIDYNIEEYNDNQTIIIQTMSNEDEYEDEYDYDGMERIEYNMFESEV